MLQDSSLASATSPVIPDESSFRVELEPGESFTFTLEDETLNDEVLTRSIGAGACTGICANPQVEAGGIVSYGLHVRCSGTGFLLLSARIRFQEEHLGLVYETVGEIYKQFTEGGYATVRGETICNPTTSGHDYRIAGEIFAGSHHGFGISKEVHLPCNVH
ncbi:hypothetical protein UL82_07265 [Corynebacterium kutscheri]|uniref:Uncharacterized protein n=1 Tax=Corynebacterium kutscheri TaxID=35755 RepID=A0A0F6R119_9CORY|nr:hypothetical protein [Corynebacterium kutscheri]AKE41615.1 hypothetical protein UL82_07265 [Corynebacterium kutscheri]VEH09941.1 putative secreted protein [Corynebacterium kutscheri]